MLHQNNLPLLLCPVGDESPYEPTSCTFFNLKGLTDTLSSMGFSVDNVELLNTYSEEEWDKMKEKLVINRATLLCTYKPEIINKEVGAYWDGIHKMSTNKPRNVDIQRPEPRIN